MNASLPDQSPALILDQVRKVYRNGTVALKDFNLKVRRGEFVSLVGASGCGKSTVLRLIAGLGEVNSGAIARYLQPDKQDIAFVFQDAALMPWATVLDNIRLPLKLAHFSSRASRQAAQEIIHRVGLTGFEKTYPRQLSGGMKMRVSIARALVNQPQLLLMDEPFGALDEITRSQLNRDLLELWEERRWTVVFVTHNIYEAVYLSNRVVVMSNRPGRVFADIPINAPYPRSEEFRTSQLCNEYCRKVGHALQEAIHNKAPWI
ncbi:ABC transporter ATP-binding protein [Spirulina sp. CS-785/01]|uniref:ABC transporter ATP-binding protein n=1 Tax=Spirulina sp. CS-785/01 TaxID=3021716 RepID=UPI00232F4587|nr:ABC transporter ATP-binding protein [Spirulina sp. CS-785/01]MDB9312918.1 ABC transporter ATP-binding protein [Spirulina sp. CS-785/01]